eukprot:6210719-Pleurochrysis_carterae.AAC.4
MMLYIYYGISIYIYRTQCNSCLLFAHVRFIPSSSSHCSLPSRERTRARRGAATAAPVCGASTMAPAHDEADPAHADTAALRETCDRACSSRRRNALHQLCGAAHMLLQSAGGFTAACDSGIARSVAFILLLLAAASQAVLEESQSCDDTLADMKLSLKCAPHVVVPEMLELPSFAFKNCTQLRSVFLPESLRSIGSSAFSGCTSLEEVHFPTTLEYIGSCTSLRRQFRCKRSPV